ncbi:MAG: thiamine-phosphate kinase [Acidobacteria bacterium]|jgi:thiamine-monophosphate kinase|nr:MAG: thiamine-phosphate kinase [Acidobacteriota bacterium]GIU83188.1 MAG: thiamine-monophosphate kinase [Pyrinomonadaceae bacterium]
MRRKSEFGFIADLKWRFRLKRVGDDCAVFSKDEKTDFVITADLLVEDVDFRLNWASAEQIGHKALAVSLSDIAAMGAKPLYALVTLGIPNSLWQTDFVEKFYKGWFKLAKREKVELIGGDISKSAEKFFVDSIVLGEVPKGKAILRSGAKNGDLIFVSGYLGNAALALKILEGKIKKSSMDSKFTKNLLSHQLQPNPETKLGVMIGERQLATAMIDISDGLSSDLWHICQASKVGARIFAEKIPISRKLRSVVNSDHEALELALHGGEDFRLLFTVKPEKAKTLQRFVPKGKKIFCIGEITASKKLELVFANRTEILNPKGFSHF